MASFTKEETLWYLARNTFLNESTYMICDSKMPLGKYEGSKVADVPVTYLIEIIADMRPSFFVVSVRRMLEDNGVMRLMLMFSNANGQLPRDITMTQMLKLFLTDNLTPWGAVE
jgi:uncharacterized protein (DUF3820 family)